ncbi:MAG: hypothetical protein V1709_11790 [Planctomycetota bacterium]
MRKMKIVNAIFIWVLIMAFPLILKAEPVEDSLWIDEFGVKKGESINSGFVFLNGKYIDVPYVVTRKGLALFLNDKMIEPPIRWPPPAAVQNENITEPKLPAAITKNTSPFDSLLIKYIGEKNAYIRIHSPPKETLKLLLKTYQELPCVDNARIDSKYPEIAIVRWHNGSSDRIRLSKFEGREPLKYDKESILGLLEGERNNLEERLKKGDTYFLFDKGGKITFGEQNTKDLLPRLVEILESKESLEIKLNLVHEIMPYVNKDTFASIVTNFSVSPQLEKRLQELIQLRQEVQ